MVKELLQTKKNIENDILSDIDDYDVYNFVIASLKREYKTPYSVLLNEILHCKLDEREAKKLWNKILNHRKELESILKRNITIKTALVDYFSQIGNNDKISIFFKDNIIEAFSLAMQDSLTGLYSHALIHEELKKEFNTSVRYNVDLSIMFIDIDNFKNYNDRFGHKNGDKLLIVLSEILQYRLRKTDKIGRYGGEEFLVILPHTSMNDAYSIAQDIVKTIERRTSKIKSLPEGVTVSIGVQQLEYDMKDENELIEAADLSMYTAKRNGKNKVYCSSIPTPNIAGEAGKGENLVQLYKSNS